MTDRRVSLVPRASLRCNGRAADEEFNGRFENLLSEWTSGFGSHTILFRVGTTVITSVGVALSLGAIVRATDPHEVHGWGERPTLRVHETFGWQLIPDRTNCLRWGSYDYFVISNHLGFPGPLYSEDRAPASCRIMNLGDAFTSAEGVGTDRSWPRLLGREMRDRLTFTSLEFLNFAISGSGPNQYGAVLAEHGPRYRPDLVVIGFSANDYLDALVSKAWFRSSIGLDLSLSSTHQGFFTLPHLRRWLHIEV